MCVTSAIMDQWNPYVPNPYHYPWPVTPVTLAPVQQIVQQIVPEYDNETLRELIDSLRQALAAAEKLDQITNQEDCVDPEKAKLMDRVEELERRLNSLEEEDADQRTT